MPIPKRNSPRKGRAKGLIVITATTRYRPIKKKGRVDACLYIIAFEGGRKKSRIFVFSTRS